MSMLITPMLFTTLFGGGCTTDLRVHPNTVHVCETGTARLSVTATGENLGYQWFKNGDPMPEETSAELIISAVDPNDEARYNCEISDSCGFREMSRNGWLFVSPPYYRPSHLTLWGQAVDAAACSDPNDDGVLDIRDLITLIANDDPDEVCQVEIAQNPSALASHRIYRAFSDDGGDSFTAENSLLLEAASVPDAILGPDGATWVYYVSGTLNQHAIWVARLGQDMLLTPIRCITLDDELLFSAVDPDIIRLRDGRFRLFFYANFGPPSPGQSDPHFIETAVSDDGIHFTREGVILETDGGTDPSALQHSSGTYVLAVPVNDLKMQIATASSDNVWTPTLQLDTSGIPELVERENGDVLLLIGQPGGNSDLKRYLSTDNGASWSQLSNVTPADIMHSPQDVNHPSIFRRSPTEWDMFYISVAE